MILKFCTKHGSFTAVLCAKFQNYWTTEMTATDKWGISRFKASSVFPILWPPGPHRTSMTHCSAWPMAITINHWINSQECAASDFSRANSLSSVTMKRSVIRLFEWFVKRSDVAAFISIKTTERQFRVLIFPNTMWIHRWFCKICIDFKWS